ncbi:MAG: hypothetical protein ACOY0T_14545 [Myxococcota bacterium]
MSFVAANDAPRSSVQRVLVLGAGYTGREVLRRAHELGLEAVGSVRRPEQASALAEIGAHALVLPELDASLARHVDAHTHVVVAFPPDGATDARIAPLLASAAAVTYVSSTSVYGGTQGRIDDTTPVPPPTADTSPRLDAEALYLALGGTVLRCPGIYGRERGLHRRIMRGEYSIPGDGSAVLSRIHVYDLASFVLASPRAPGQVFVVGDLQPATHRELVAWICTTYAVPLPSSASGRSQRSLLANRAIDSERARRRLGVELRYPTFREGMSPGA